MDHQMILWWILVSLKKKKKDSIFLPVSFGMTSGLLLEGEFVWKNNSGRGWLIFLIRIFRVFSIFQVSVWYFLSFFVSITTDSG